MSRLRLGATINESLITVKQKGNEMLKIFIERLVAARGSKNQGEAAELLGISRARLSNYEIGKREPDLSTLKQIVETYGVSADWLLGLSDSRTHSSSVSATGGYAAAANNSTATVHVDSSTECAQLRLRVERLEAALAGLSSAGHAPSQQGSTPSSMSPESNSDKKFNIDDLSNGWRPPNW